jgi:hypothetical protein
MPNTEFWTFIQDMVPPVAVVFLFVASIIWGIKPIVEKMIDRMSPLFDRAISVVEAQGSASLKLAQVLETSMQDQRSFFEERIAHEKGERIEQIAMLQKRIADLETENAALKSENNSLKEQLRLLRSQLERQNKRKKAEPCPKPAASSA